MSNQPSPANWLRWFDPRHRQPGTWAFILNRITALGLSVYLVMHLYMLSKLAQGPEAYDTFITLAKTPVVKFGEMFVVAGVMIHGFNGIRIALTSFGIGVRRQKEFFWAMMALAALATAVIGWRMFFGE